MFDKPHGEPVVESFRDKLQLLFSTGGTRLRMFLLDRWRLLFLVFASVYSVILMFALTGYPLLWDEVSHLSSGSLLYLGRYGEFLGNAFYPPLFDTLTFISFKILGVSLFTARLPSVFFAFFALWAVFEFARYLYGSKVGILSAIMLGIMPGFFWLSGHAMLETILIFFVTVSLFCFYRWLNTRQDKLLALSGLALGLGFLAKYQILVVGVIMLLSIVLLARKQVKAVFKKFKIVITAAVLVVVPWVILAFQVYKTGFLGQWFYVLQIGNPGRSVYSSRFPLPIFYFIEMVWPHNNFHPISLFCYIIGLAGLAWMVWRRRHEDKFILLWFAVIFVFFTLISNKDWRYVVPLFPTLAISASVAVLGLGGALKRMWKKPISVSKKHLAKVASGVLVVVVASAMIYSVYDTYNYNSTAIPPIDIQGATNYALNNIEDGKSIMVLLPCNLFNRDMVQFYLWAGGDRGIEIFQYPEVAVDAYVPNFNFTEFTELCSQHNVQYIIAFEYGGVEVPYYNTTLTFLQVYEQLYVSDNFSYVTEELCFGTTPWWVFVMEFTEKP
ncbi:MAG: glycosyltransferase family 39 protein [Candidatus Bathyarchaeota archaeon]|nr:glycosyltransferase family 39 protein [Candidatus Termiticorpusculum sp.]